MKPDQSIVITGATSGLGRDLSLFFAERFPENKLVLLGRNEVKLEAIKNQLNNNNCLIRVADFSTLEWADSLLYSDIPRIGLLIHNAGFFDTNSVLDSTKASIENTITTNVSSPLLLTRKLSDKFDSNTHVITIGSLGSYTGLADAGIYATSKHALLGFTRSLRKELSSKGIKVTCLMPGPMFTDSWKGSGVDGSQLIQTDDVALLIETIVSLSPSTNIDEVILNPLNFDRNPSN